MLKTGTRMNVKILLTGLSIRQYQRILLGSSRQANIGLSSCDGNDPDVRSCLFVTVVVLTRHQNPLDWKSGGSWRRGERTYKINIKRQSTVASNQRNTWQLSRTILWMSLKILDVRRRIR